MPSPDPLFAVALAEATSHRPHLRSPRSVLLGATFGGTGLRRRRAARRRGPAYSPDYSPDTAHPDLAELAWVHATVLPALARSHRDSGMTGGVPSLQQASTTLMPGTVPWTRLCVDTSHGYRGVIDGRPEHVDVALLPLDPASPTYRADLAILLPAGLPPDVTAHPVRRLHHPGDGRVVPDDGERWHTVAVTQPGFGYRASLLVVDGRVLRAEVVLSARWNAQSVTEVLTQGLS